MPEIREAPDEPGRSTRAVVVFRHPMVRDLTVGLLERAGVTIVASVAEAQLSPLLMDALCPDVVVVDQDAEEALGAFGLSTLFSTSRRSAARVVAVGLSDPTLIVCDKRLLANASAADLVDAVLAGPAGAAPPRGRPTPVDSPADHPVRSGGQ